MMKGEQLIDDHQAADLLAIKPQTLRKWRMLGTGPDFVKIGRITRYQVSALNRWIEQHAREAA